MDKKNIVIFLDAFWNNGRGMSGGDQMLIQIFKRIKNEFGDVKCFTNADGKREIERDISGIKFRISSILFDKLPLGVNYILRTLQSLIVLFDSKEDFSYGGSDFFPDVFPLFLHKLFHKKTKWVQCVFHIYPDWKRRPGNKMASFIAQYLQRFSFLFIKKADIIININNQVGEELIKIGFDKDKIFVNTPGINVEYLINFKITENTPKYDASFLARLNPSKGVFDLIEIWKRVVAKMPNAKLAIIGGGSMEVKNKLKEEIKNNKLEKNIKVLGFLENDESFSVIKNSKVFVFPSHEEGFGIAIAEAMALGVPVVSWNLPVYDEIFENHSLRVSENDADSFAEAVIGLMGDDGKRADLSSKAKDFVVKYSWDEIAKKHLNILLKK